MDADKLLYKSFIEGDNDAFEELVLKYKDNLIYFLQRYVKDISTCEDVAQDVFAYIFTFKEKYDSKYAFKTFLFTIAKNKAVDYIRKQSKLVPIAEIEHTSSDTDELFLKVVQDENARLVHNSIKQLKPDYQRAIHLIDFEEMSYKEAALIMGKSMAQLKITVHRARYALKKLLEKGGYTH